MKEQIKVFGSALDPLNSPERLNLKLAYLASIAEEPEAKRNYDPFDAMKDYLNRELSSLDSRFWFGKMQIESWLTPRPKPTDAHFLRTETFTDFLYQNGCWNYALRVRDYVKEQILPSKPVMIGVDHSLTGGVIMALSRHWDNLNVIVFDAHFDVLKKQNLDSIHQLAMPDYYGENSSLERCDEVDFYGCGNFICHLLEQEIISPDNLWVLGVHDNVLKSLKMKCRKDNAVRSQIGEYEKWIRKGVHLITKTDLVAGNFHLDLNGPTYISVDMDVGSLSSVFSARFMNCFGLTYKEFVEALGKLSQIIIKSDVPVVGLDIMEIDIHLLEAAELSQHKDYTRPIAREIFQKFCII